MTTSARVATAIVAVALAGAGAMKPAPSLASEDVARATATPAAAPPPATSAAEPVARYLDDLEAAGLLGTGTGTIENLRRELISAEDELVSGNLQSATTRLFGVLESPRFAAFAQDPEYASAELTLGRALVRAGAYGAAERYLLRVLGRGPKHPSFGPAYRAMVDVALESRDEPRVLGQLDGAATPEQLPIDASNERAYLAAKVKYAAGELSQAGDLFARVGRQSRFFAAALYFRGLIAARGKNYEAARRNLCEIVGQEDQNSFSFYVDGRYFAIKDLAYLALGRIAHEQGRFDDAYYFYFRIPEDSERLPEALYEAAWSMFQKGEYRAASAFIEQFDRTFPTSPLAPDVLLLRAMIMLKSCRFDDVRKTLDQFVSTYAPIQEEVARLAAQPDRRRAVYRRVLSRREIGRAPDPIVELLKLDQQFFRYFGYLTALDREATLVPQGIAMWDELTAAARSGGDPAAPGAQASEAVQLIGEAEALVADARGNPEIEDDAQDLLRAARRAARPVSGSGPFSEEVARLRALAEQSRALRARLVEAASTIAERALLDLDRRLKGLLRQARLTHIDAIIGKKKRLEIEIANLQQGRYPRELLGALEAEGLLGDDEEYWPYEGEYWADEYENYR